MTDKSNAQGRALEYITAVAIRESVQNSEFTGRTLESNERDRQHYDRLDASTRASFDLFAKALSKWLGENYLSGSSHALIDRFLDTSGQGGDPTDILIAYSKSGKKLEIRLSIKNRQPALKHQRIKNLPGQLGIVGGAASEEFQKGIESIWNSALAAANQDIHIKKKHIKRFRDLPTSLKMERLYLPCNKLVTEFIKKNQTPAAVESFFDFITGGAGIIVAVNYEDSIEIRVPKGDFKRPSRVSVIPKENSKTTIVLAFDNGWKISMRLHNAEEFLYSDGKSPERSTGSPSNNLKYDTQLLKDAGQLNWIELEKEA